MKKLIIILLIIVCFGFLLGDAPTPNMSFAGRWGSGPCMDVASIDHYAYYLGLRTGVEVLDMTVLERPVKVGNVLIEDHPNGEMPSEKELVIQGSYAYVIAAYNETKDSVLELIDLENPANPSIESFLFFSGDVTGLAVNGNIAVVSLREGGIKIFDVSNPFVPKWVADYFIDGVTVDVAARGNYVYAVNRNSMRIIDVSVAAAPRLTGTYTLTDNDISSVDISADDKYAFIGGYGGLVTIDIRNPFAPQEMNFYRLPYLSKIEIKQNIAYVSGSSTMYLLDILNPSAPQELAKYHVFYALSGFAVSGQTIYIANGVNGLRVLDFSDYEETKEIGHYNQVTDTLIGVKVRDGIVYTMHQQSFYAIDAGNANNPYMRGKNRLSGSYPSGLRLKDQYAYHASMSGFHILDISDPHQPVSVGYYAYRWFQTYGLALKDHYAFTVSAGSQLEVVDVGDPTNPQQAASLDGIAIGGIEGNGDYLYILSSAVGLQVIDISQIESPVLVKTVWVDIPAEMEDWPITYMIEPQIKDNYLYIPGHRGLEVLDITNPADPVKVGLGTMDKTAYAVAIDGHYAFVVREDGNMHIFDLSVPKAPQQAGILTIPNGARNIYAADHYLYVTTKNNQMQIHRIGDCLEGPVSTLMVSGSWEVGEMKELTWIIPPSWKGDELLNLELYQDNYRIGTIGENIKASTGTFTWSVGSAVNHSLRIEPGNRFNLGFRKIQDNCLTLSNNVFTIQDPGVSVDLEITRVEDASLLSSRLCNRIDIMVTKQANAVEVGSYLIKRRTEYNTVEWLDLIPATVFQNGTYSYFDCNIEEYSTYEYYIEAVHPNGAIIKDAYGIQRPY
jgi:hypothetical protein